MPFRKFHRQICGHEYDETLGDPAAGDCAGHPVGRYPRDLNP